MAYLNADIPPIYCKIRKEYLYDLEKHQGESVDCCVFSVVSITDRALLFNIMLPNGACFWRLPISAFFQEKFERSEVVDMPIDQLQIWNSFSYYPSVHCFSFLRGKRGKYFGKDKINYPFEYLFTIDWGHPESNILTRSILKFPQSTNVLTYLPLITVTMQHNQTIVSYGMRLTTQQIEKYRTIQSKALDGM